MLLVPQVHNLATFLDLLLLNHAFCSRLHAHPGIRARRFLVAPASTSVHPRSRASCLASSNFGKKRKSQRRKDLSCDEDVRLIATLPWHCTVIPGSLAFRLLLCCNAMAMTVQMVGAGGARGLSRAGLRKREVALLVAVALAPPNKGTEAG
ncbi:hypothetical protein SEVIR_6G204501v4 [Setaria viridis]